MALSRNSRTSRFFRFLKDSGSIPCNRFSFSRSSRREFIWQRRSRLSFPSRFFDKFRVAKRSNLRSPSGSAAKRFPCRSNVSRPRNILPPKSSSRLWAASAAKSGNAHSSRIFSSLSAATIRTKSTLSYHSP